MLEVTGRAGDHYVTLSDGKSSIDVHEEQLANTVAQLLMGMTVISIGMNFPMDEGPKAN